MIAIAGPARKITTVFHGLSWFFGIHATIYTLFSIAAISFIHFSAARLLSTPLTARLENVGICLSVFTACLAWAMTFLIMWMGNRFACGGPSLILRVDGIFFPLLPGFRKGRFIPWRYFMSCLPVDKNGLRRLQKALFIACKLLYPTSVIFKIRLDRPVKEIPVQKGLVAAIYRSNDPLVKLIFERSERPYLISEMLAVPISAHLISQVLELLARNERVRNSVLSDAETRVISNDSDVLNLIRELENAFEGSR